jgi:hypothetical protein
MYDLFLRLLRDEINSDKLTSIPQIKVSEYESFIKNSVEELIYSGREAKEVFTYIVKNIFRDSGLLAKFRMAKSVLNNEVSEDSIDREILRKNTLLARFLKLYLSRLIIDSGGRLGVIFKKDIILGNRRYKAGDLALLPLSDALNYYLLEAVEPILNPYIEYVLSE